MAPHAQCPLWHTALPVAICSMGLQHRAALGHMCANRSSAGTLIMS